jgi:pyruvate-formate lyase-activating enzyme
MKFFRPLIPGLGEKDTVLRYWAPILRSGKRIGLTKMANALWAECERRMRKHRTTSLPFVLHFELTNICNLQCPYCYTGRGVYETEKGYLAFKNFTRVVDEISDKLILARLDGYGESFLHPDVFAMIRYLHNRNVVTSLSTNFNTLEPRNMGELIDSGLDYLIIALDGADKATYEQHRVGGSFDKIMENIKAVVAKRQAMGSRTPYLEIQFLLLEGTATQLDRMKELAASLGVDRLVVKEARNEKNTPVREEASHKVRPCYWLWEVLNLNWQCDIKVCCDGLMERFSFANVLQSGVRDGWNCSAMENVRKLFTKNTSETRTLLAGCRCLSCYKLGFREESTAC